MEKSEQLAGAIVIPKQKVLIVVAAIVIALVLGLTLLVNFQRPPESPDFTQYEAGPERKSAFFSYMTPLVQQRNAEILDLREQVQQLYDSSDSLPGRQQRELLRIGEEYGLESFDVANTDQWNQLLRRIDIVPEALALAQAANESAWGTSNFARAGNNFYGHWCFVEGCGIVPAARESGAVHEVAKFSSAQESVRKYIANLNVHEAYQPMRLIRAELRSNGESLKGEVLAEGLNKYSERGVDYVEDIKSIIRVNKLDELDELD